MKLVDGSIVVIEAKHPERPDEEFGCISRHFLHRYRLPSDVDPGSLMSQLSDKGILTVTAQKVSCIMFYVFRYFSNYKMRTRLN